MIKTYKSIIIYIFGKPGVGKYTIANIISRNNNFIICDNQLVNTPILKLLQNDGYHEIPDYAWKAIDQIRNEILNFLTMVPDLNYILTDCLYENENHKKIFSNVKKMADTRNSLFIPVQIKIDKNEHLNRIKQPERREKWKTINPFHAENNLNLISISHQNLLEIDVSNMLAENAAINILNHVKNLKTC